MSERHQNCVLDNFSNSSPEALARVSQLTNVGFEQIKTDIRDNYTLAKAFNDLKPEAVLHFAGLKAVGELYPIFLSDMSQPHGPQFVSHNRDHGLT